MHSVPRRLIAMAMDVIDSTCLLYTSLLSVEHKTKEDAILMFEQHTLGK